MKRFSPDNSRLVFCLLCGLWLLCGAKTYAQNAPLTMNVDSPLSRIAPLSDAPTDAKNVRPLTLVARFGRWFPLAVTLNNTGDAVSGRLQLRLTSSAGAMDAVSTFVSDVDLPSNARKRVWLYGRIERGEIDGGTVNFSGRGIETQVFKFALSSPDEATPIALTISDNDERLSFVSSFAAIHAAQELLIAKRNAQPNPGTPGNFGAPPPPATSFNSGARAVEMLGASHDWVPSRWVGFDGVDLLVLHDFPHSSLAPEQLDAVRDYAASGGTILVLGGANWQRLAQSPLRELWPLQPTSSQRVNEKQTANIVRAYVPNITESGDRLGGAPVVVASGALAARAQPLTANLSPDVASWLSFGAGRVLWLAFDPTRPPFVGWRGQSQLWANVFGQRSHAVRLEDVDPAMENFTSGNNYPPGGYYAGNTESTGNSPSALANRLRSEMVRSPQLKTPASSSIAWFLALYVFFLVPVNYVVLRAIDKREWAWFTVPLVVIIFSALSFVAALRIKGTQVRQRQVNMVFGSNQSGRARADSLLWLFSPRKTSYAIAAQNAEGQDLATMSLAPFADTRRSDALNNAEIVQPGADQSMKIDETPINMWDYKTFVGHAVVDAGKGVTWKRDRQGFSVTNATPFDWHGAVWVDNQSVTAVGDVKSGATSNVSAPYDNAMEQEMASRILKQSAVEKIFPDAGTDARGRMARAALRAALAQAQFADQSRYLVAWGVQPVASLHAQNIEDAPQQVTLFVWQMDKAVD